MNNTIQRTVVGTIVALTVAFICMSIIGPGGLIVGIAAAVVMFGARNGNGGEVSGGTQGAIVMIGKIILTFAATGILGVGFFCGGLFAAFGSNNMIIAILIWGIGIIVWLSVMKGIFYRKKSPKELVSSPIVLPVTNKYQKAVVDYMIQARAAGLIDQAIMANLLAAGWTESDVNFGFEAVGGKK